VYLGCAHLYAYSEIDLVISKNVIVCCASPALSGEVKLVIYTYINTCIDFFFFLLAPGVQIYTYSYKIKKKKKCLLFFPWQVSL
jgi:hypothetical protein